MEVLEAIRSRRTARMPFDEAEVPGAHVGVLESVAGMAPDGGTVAWRLVRIEDTATKAKLAEIVRSEFGSGFQRDRRRFREVFSQYPRWLRFSPAEDGIQLVGMPRFMRHFYRVALGRTLGPWFGRMGIMNPEIESYCRNITGNPVLFGVFLELRARTVGLFKPIVNAGAMLQNLRLAATSLGLRYQDIGWITATKRSSDRARKLLGMPEGLVPVNFFRVGHARSPGKETKRSNFRRRLEDVVHVRRFGTRSFRAPAPMTTRSEIIEAIRGESGRSTAPGAAAALGYVLEAARWAPTGFNVQPFEFVLHDREGGTAIVVIEDHGRPDPDPGPCEALARGGVLQNIRLAARALGTPCELRPPAGAEEGTRAALSIPATHSIVGVGRLSDLTLGEIAQ